MTKLNLGSNAILLGSVATIALLSSHSALAQESTEVDASNVNDNVITVTATKREEDAQDVPIAITALSDELITASGVTNTEDLRAAVPALNVTTAVGGFGLPRIRGIGATGQGPSIENPVAVYVDGVYYTAAFGNLLSLADAEQVAVLKGPQGTLFGRNATGGLIQVTTRGPSFDFQASGSVGYGNYDTITASGFVSGPITSNLAISASGQYQDQSEGFGTNVITGNEVQTNENYAGRGKILWEPDAMTSILLSGDFSGFDGANPAFRAIGLNAQGVNVQNAIANLGGDPEYDILADSDPFVKGRQWGVTFDANRDFDGISLRIISAYRSTKLQSFFDPDGTPAPRLRIDNRQRSRQFTQEINLVSDNDGPFNWVAGVFYMHEESGEQPFSRTTGLFTFGDNGYRDNISKATLDSIAGFFEGTYAFGPNTNFTAGFRYSNDERDLERQTIAFNGNIPGATEVVEASITADLSNSEPTWRLSLDHRFSDELMAYASYNRGFRSGAFVVGANPFTTLDPEKVDAYEVGIKSDLLDGRIRLNIAGYYYDQSSVQVMQVISGVQNIYNADGAKVLGLDADVSIEITDNLRIFGGVNITDATYKSFTNAVIATPFPLPAGFTIPAGQRCLGTFGNPFTQVGGNCLLIGDASGNKLQNTPDFTSSAGFIWDVPTSAGVFSLSGNWYHNSGYPADIDQRVLQPSYDLLNASVTWRDPSETYYIRLWGRNLANEYYYSQLGASNSGDNGYPGAPRTYGVEVGFDF